MSDDLRSQLATHLDNLNAVMPEFRKAEDRMKTAKAALCSVNVKLAAADDKVSAGDLARMVDACLKAW